ncbi:MAG: DUF4290 domain-containing protein [Bacteroidales bacterium]|jgi:hypothetical protein|nr:DUF4290 domain-containing protein [Bacteroidales bacterium]
MDYNTQRPELSLPEYGRHIQKMVDHLKTIHDRELRNSMAKALINVMGNMNPHLRDVPDFKHKLWDHLAVMSDFELDIDWPYQLPKKDFLEEKPAKVPYNNEKFKYKHYGKNLQLMLAKVNEFEGETKDMLIEQLANHMKISYVNWKKETVNDECIFEDIQRISEETVEIPDNLSLSDVKQPKPKVEKRNFKGKKKHFKKKYKN